MCLHGWQRIQLNPFLYPSIIILNVLHYPNNALYNASLILEIKLLFNVTRIYLER